MVAQICDRWSPARYILKAPDLLQSASKGDLPKLFCIGASVYKLYPCRCMNVNWCWQTYIHRSVYTNVVSMCRGYICVFLQMQHWIMHYNLHAVFLEIVLQQLYVVFMVWDQKKLGHIGSSFGASCSLHTTCQPITVPPGCFPLSFRSDESTTGGRINVKRLIIVVTNGGGI